MKVILESRLEVEVPYADPCRFEKKALMSSDISVPFLQTGNVTADVYTREFDAFPTHC